MVDDRHAAPMALVRMSDYTVKLEGEGAGKAIEQIPAFLAQSEIFAVKKTKSGEKQINARALVQSLEALDEHTFNTRLSLTESQSMKPEMLVSLLAGMAGVEAPQSRVHRTLLLGLDEQDNPTPLMML